MDNNQDSCNTLVFNVTNTKSRNVLNFGFYFFIAAGLVVIAFGLFWGVRFYFIDQEGGLEFLLGPLGICLLLGGGVVLFAFSLRKDYNKIAKTKLTVNLQEKTFVYTTYYGTDIRFSSSDVSSIFIYGKDNIFNKVKIFLRSGESMLLSSIMYCETESDYIYDSAAYFLRKHAEELDLPAMQRSYTSPA